MPKIRNVVKHLKLDTAVGERTCHAKTSHKIQPGERHLADWGSGTRENICFRCAPAILAAAAVAIADLQTKVSAPKSR